MILQLYTYDSTILDVNYNMLEYLTVDLFKSPEKYHYKIIRLYNCKNKNKLNENGTNKYIFRNNVIVPKDPTDNRIFYYNKRCLGLKLGVEYHKDDLFLDGDGVYTLSYMEVINKLNGIISPDIIENNKYVGRNLFPRTKLESGRIVHVNNSYYSVDDVTFNYVRLCDEEYYLLSDNPKKGYYIEKDIILI